MGVFQKRVDRDRVRPKNGTSPAGRSRATFTGGRERDETGILGTLSRTE